MKNCVLCVLSLFSFNSFAQFKEQVVINGISYDAAVNTALHATYIQKDYLDFSLAPDSFYVDSLTDEEWDIRGDELISDGAVWQNGMYHTGDGRQVMVGDERDTANGNLLIFTLFGSVDNEK